MQFQAGPKTVREVAPKPANLKMSDVTMTLLVIKPLGMLDFEVHVTICEWQSRSAFFGVSRRAAPDGGYQNSQ